MSRHLASVVAVALCTPALLAPSVPGCPDCDLAIVDVDSPKVGQLYVTVKNIGGAKTSAWVDLFEDATPGFGDKAVATRAVETLLPGESVTLLFQVEAEWDAFVLLDEGASCVGSCLDANLASVYDIRSEGPKYSIDRVVPGSPSCPICL